MAAEKEFAMGLTPEFPLSVLFVEQKPEAVEAALMSLRAAHFEINFDIAETAETFVERVRTGSYDVILSAYQMNEWAGLDALELLKRTGYDIPFIVVSEPLGERTAVECFKKGVTDYVVTEEMDRLAPAVFHALEEKALRNERRQSDRMLKTSETQFRALADAIPMAVFIERGTQCQYVNRSAEHLTGYSKADLLQMNFWQMILPSSKRALLDRSVEISVAEFPAVSRYETQILTKGGELRWLDVSVGVFRMDGGLAALITAHDITEQRKQHKKMAEKEFALVRMSEERLWGGMLENGSARVAEARVASRA
jgi:PAS domain S-box-containing protein